MAMDRQTAREEVRRAIAAAQYDVSPPSLAAWSNERIDSLQLDSLAKMEFCIAIELRTGLEFTPENLDQVQTLDDIVEWILQRAH